MTGGVDWRKRAIVGAAGALALAAAVAGALMVYRWIIVGVFRNLQRR